jgi:hypothetical protein
MVKIHSPWAFPNSFNLSETLSFEIFVKSFFNQILIEQGKVQLSNNKVQKTVPFFRKKLLKNQKYALDF